MKTTSDQSKQLLQDTEQALSKKAATPSPYTSVLLDEKSFQKKLRIVKKSHDYPLMVALADIVIDSFIASKKGKISP